MKLKIKKKLNKSNLQVILKSVFILPGSMYMCRACLKPLGMIFMQKISHAEQFGNEYFHIHLWYLR